MSKKHLTLDERRAYRSLEDVVGCKWSAAVVAAIHEGVRRPGRLQRYIPGISTKVLNERLRRLSEYQLIRKQDLSEGNQLHVEYHLTPSGEKLALVIKQLHVLNQSHQSGIREASGQA